MHHFLNNYSVSTIHNWLFENCLFSVWDTLNLVQIIYEILVCLLIRILFYILHIAIFITSPIHLILSISCTDELTLATLIILLIYFNVNFGQRWIPNICICVAVSCNVVCFYIHPEITLMYMQEKRTCILGCHNVVSFGS